MRRRQHKPDKLINPYKLSWVINLLVISLVTGCSSGHQYTGLAHDMSPSLSMPSTISEGQYASVYTSDKKIVTIRVLYADEATLRGDALAVDGKQVQSMKLEIDRDDINRIVVRDQAPYWRDKSEAQEELICFGEIVLDYMVFSSSDWACFIDIAFP